MIDVKPKGLELPKRKLPKELKKLTEKYKKPEIDIKFRRKVVWYASKIGEWLVDKSSVVIGKALSLAIPKWFWFALIGAIVVIGLIIWLV